MASKAVVKTSFETGDTPTQAQFETWIDSAVFGNGAAVGIVEVESTASTTLHTMGAVGRQLLLSAATASAQNALGVGAVGRQLLESTATASAQLALGAGTVGLALIGAVATASAVNHLGAGAVGVQLLSAIATASAQNQLGLGTANTPTFAGINLGDENLNDYDEGTWTPTITSSGGGAASYTVQTGAYTRIGRQVFIYFSVTLSSKNTLGVGDLGFSGLPFTCNASFGGTLVFHNVGQVTFAAGDLTFVGAINSGATAGAFSFVKSGGAVDSVVVADVSDTFILRASGSYFI